MSGDKVIPADTLKMLEAAEAKVRDLEWRIAANAGRLSEKSKPRWVHVSDATGHEKTFSILICVSSGIDPEEMIGGEHG